MQVSSEGLTSMIVRNMIVEGVLLEETALVEHCKNPDQFGLGCSSDDKNQAECHRRSYVDMVDDEQEGDVICKTG